MQLYRRSVMNVLLYGLEAYQISNKPFKSLDFVLKGCFRKIFRTKSAEVVQNCMPVFNYMAMQECLPCAYLVWPCLEVNPHDKA